MKMFGWLTAFVLVVVTFSKVAYAESMLFTPPMDVDISSSGAVLLCNIVNVSKKTQTVTILPNGGCTAPTCVYTLYPGQRKGVAMTSADVGCLDGTCSPSICAFKVNEKPDFRAAICGGRVGSAASCLPAE